MLRFADARWSMTAFLLHYLLTSSPALPGETAPARPAAYLEYIDYLQDRGLLEAEVEELELEELQGVKGLLALRVKVKL